jgi:hypothetical protein
MTINWIDGRMTVSANLNEWAGLLHRTGGLASLRKALADAQKLEAAEVLSQGTRNVPPLLPQEDGKRVSGHRLL